MDLISTGGTYLLNFVKCLCQDANTFSYEISEVEHLEFYCSYLGQIFSEMFERCVRPWRLAQREVLNM